MGRGRHSDLDHIRTPIRERGALWWMQEHGIAEQAVTIASRALDAATDEHARRTFARQLDVRLDHLAHVEDCCYELIDRLRVSDGEIVAGACESHYLHGETWADVAAGMGVTKGCAATMCQRALCRLDRAGVRVFQS